MFSRTELLIGSDALNKLKDSHVAVFGIGGVGSYTVEALTRGGVGTLSLFDGDVVSVSNINRQLIATSENIGQKKTEAAIERIKKINPQTVVYGYDMFIDALNISQVNFSEFDYVVDAIDTVTSKLLLIEYAKKAGVKVISCMGAGNKLDPTAFEIADISKTTVCPLARVMRRELRIRGIKDVKVLYSKEPAIIPLNNSEKRITGSISFVPSVAGLIIAGEVIKDLKG
ncbi:MAG: tRNA threonylcarbamoyladenosine dehydratase [Ruminococcaceae bacterium]|nr:tRNA threonylcarbamoyladenosine dehydratase [Oscillospiraceae bacterium]